MLVKGRLNHNGKAAAQQLFYYIRPPLPGCQGRGPNASQRTLRSKWKGCCAATILLYPAPLAGMLGERTKCQSRNGEIKMERLLRSSYSIISGFPWMECQGRGPMLECQETMKSNWEHIGCLELSIPTLVHIALNCNDLVIRAMSTSGKYRQS